MKALVVDEVRRPRRPWPTVVGLVAASVALVATVVVLRPMMTTSTTVDEVTIVNPLPWNVEVVVAHQGDPGGVGLGGVSHDATQTFEQVLDQGDVWEFRFTYAGESVRLTVRRAELRAGGWKVTVPDDLARRLEAKGVPVSA